MDHYSILDQSPAPPAAEQGTPGAGVNRSSATQPPTASVSAGIAAANARLAKLSETGLRFPGEDAGRSLAAMAHGDLDAALQLLAERAQYITAASGAAIALRRGELNDMLCRASVGSNAPELGALLSMEYGLSGESVRTRQVLRCDDAERDPRVNREVCHDLGIASVVVMPIMSEQRVLGVFELLSGKPRAFDERDLSALARLGDMVETAVKHASAAEAIPTAPKIAPAQSPPQVQVNVVTTPKSESSTRAVDSVPPASAQPFKPAVAEATKVTPSQRQEEVVPIPKKALFWSAAMRAQGSAQTKENAEAIAVPPVLRKLQKCQACGFPVSQGRALCVECEEKQWRGQRFQQSAVGEKGEQLPQTPSAVASGHVQGTFVQASPVEVPVHTSELASGELATSGLVPEINKKPQTFTTQPIEAAIVEEPSVGETSITSSSAFPVNEPASDNSTPFLSSALPSESWLAANKYILGALLVVTIVIGVIAWLR